LIKRLKRIGDKGRLCRTLFITVKDSEYSLSILTHAFDVKYKVFKELKTFYHEYLNILASIYSPKGGLKKAGLTPTNS
jgi:hypothetical protein